MTRKRRMSLLDSDFLGLRRTLGRCALLGRGYRLVTVRSIFAEVMSELPLARSILIRKRERGYGC